MIVYAADRTIVSTRITDKGLEITYSDGLVEAFPDGVNSNANTGKFSTGTGPGSGSGVIYQQSEAAMEGPKVEAMELSETYNEVYQIYEESLNKEYYFYSNVGNGGITNKPVELDIPKNLSCSLEKDGEEIPYVPGSPIYDFGSYMLRIAVASDPTKPFQNQTIYRTTFRFRIQEKPPQTEPATAAAPVIQPSQVENVFVPGVPNKDLPSESISDEGARDFSYDEFNSLFGQQTTAQSTEEQSFVMETTSFEEEETEPSLEDETEPSLESETESSGSRAQDNGKFLVGAGFTSRYDRAERVYRHELLTGTTFATSVPNGMITNNSVQAPVKEGVNYALYKDGELVDNYTPGQTIVEPGSYILFISESTVDFTNAYGRDRRIPFHFRILDSEVNDLCLFPVPQGLHFTKVKYNGGEAPEGVLMGDTVHFLFDGTYDVTMQGEEGELTTTITTDTLPPVFAVQTVPNLASVIYANEAPTNVVRSELYLGERLTSGDEDRIVQEVTRAGNYTLAIYDRAGNMSWQQFSVKYRVNTAAVIAILLVIALVVGLVLFLRRINKSINVR